MIAKVAGVPQVDEFRPITLLNTDYKLLSKLLVKRVKPVLKSIIKSSQLCTVQNKNILFGVSNVLSSVMYINSQNQGIFLLSLDFFKAYDRVVIGYLLRVMKKMNFSSTVCNWIKMMHEGAKTRFILTTLSKAIEVGFSIRQGDPLSMILYIIYIEPLLLFLEKNLRGLMVAGIPQTLEAFCDDVNIMTSHLEDLMKVDKIIVEFEKFSGAILSRSKKCKILGLGKWKNRRNWPLDYIQTEKELKIFGVYICNSYRSILKRNWDYRYGKFNNCVQSWSSRYFPSIYEKVTVLRVFALSRVFYLASILPISNTLVRKMESVMGRFIWKGCLLRVAIAEIKNKTQRGGLNHVCLQAMCKSLLLSQLLRLLKSSDSKTIAHIAYWIGDTLVDLDPDLDSGPHPLSVPDYFGILESLVVFGRISNMIGAGIWKQVTNKMLYHVEAQNFQATKVETDTGVLNGYSAAWVRINLHLLRSVEKETLFLLVHNKLPLRERIFRIGLAADPYCVHCDDAIICDAEHFFCSCSRVEEVWQPLKHIILRMVGIGNVSNSDLIKFLYPSCNQENEVIWLVANYVFKVWDINHKSSKYLVKEQFFGYLKFKFKQDQQGARIRVNDIPGLT